MQSVEQPGLINLDLAHSIVQDHLKDTDDGGASLLNWLVSVASQLNDLPPSQNPVIDQLQLLARKDLVKLIYDARRDMNLVN